MRLICKRRLGLAVLVAREGIDATAEEFGSLSLVEIELPAHLQRPFGAFFMATADAASVDMAASVPF